jgi:hypothetical protein
MTRAKRKPRIRLSRSDRADPFSVPYRVRDVLRKAGRHVDADEFLERAERCQSVEHMLALADEYVQIIRPAAERVRAEPVQVTPGPVCGDVPPPVSGLLGTPALPDVDSTIHDRELLQNIAFALREAAGRIRSLGRAARADEVRERLFSLARDMSQQADVIEEAKA